MIKIENFRDCEYSYESTTLQSYLNKLEEYLQKCRMNKTEDFNINRKEKMNLMKSKYDEIHRLVDKIKDINDNDADFLIAPIDHDSVLREDKEEDMLSLNDLKDNIPSVKGNFVEVPVMLNE